ncbi:hypothetical protein BX600DRAFT_512191 [Xylariales sp. PMI_506]|nr:hypothetical protein BX600DRAFT_512191 [Xylariales sp. PMI_506]
MPISENDPSFLDEIWALYGIGATILLLRFAVRIKMVGIKGFQGDDFFSILVLLLYTIDAATVHVVYYHGTNVEASVLLATQTLSDEVLADYTLGSKVELVAWYSYTALIWALKGTMLCFFQRITTGLWQHRLVRWLMYACVVSYVAVFITVTFGCFPTQKNWQVVPDPGLKCTFKLQNFIVAVVLNVLTDAAILCIPLPLLWTLQIPLKRKLVIGLLICSGFFVISAAIIRVVLTLGANPSALNINRWGVRETIVGILTVNIPILRPMFSATFWKTGQVTAPSKGGTTGGRTTVRGGAHGPYEMTGSMGGASRRGRTDSFGGSEELIIDKDDPKINASGVVVHTVYHVTSEEAASESDDQWGGKGGASQATAYRSSAV